jgi:hypothetical protein
MTSRLSLAGLRGWRSQDRGGSSPPFRTNHKHIKASCGDSTFRLSPPPDYRTPRRQRAYPPRDADSSARPALDLHQRHRTRIPKLKSDPSTPDWRRASVCRLPNSWPVPERVRPGGRRWPLTLGSPSVGPPVANLATRSLTRAKCELWHACCSSPQRISTTRRGRTGEVVRLMTRCCEVSNKPMY